MLPPGLRRQGGGPAGVGRGGPGYDLLEETNDLKFEPGVLSMAKSGAAVNGSQFFITLGAAPHLEGDFTGFGRVTEGREALTAMTAGAPTLPRMDCSHNAPHLGHGQALGGSRHPPQLFD